MTSELDAVRDHLKAEYAGVFDDAMIEDFLEQYVGMGQAVDLVDRVRRERPDARTVLDVGCGYGSFVLAARDAGLDAVGLELAEYELAYARRRLAAARPDDDPAQVYVGGSGLELPFPEHSFDVVTAWNVLEHVEELPSLLAEVRRVLHPGGSFLAVAPNYAAVRVEAHYHVFWPPLFPRRAAVRYLRLRGRDPRFFESSIFYRTNVGVRRALLAAGLQVETPGHQISKLRDPDAVRRPSLRRALKVARRTGLTAVIAMGVAAAHRNPVRTTIDVHARKPSS